MNCIFGCILFSIFVIALNKLWCFWSRSKVCLVGKTAIITGGASGLGYQTALVLASKGCRVIIADIINISKSVNDLIKETHNPNIIGKKVDLASFKSVREFAKDILDTESKVDILICNAGIAEVKDNYTEDGILRIMQINYFSHFLLIHLLLGLLKKSAPSRIIFTSSLLAYVSDMTLESLNPKIDYVTAIKSRYTGKCYSNSKLALAALAKVLGKKLEGTGVTVNVAHPGGVKTAIYSSALKNDLNIVLLCLQALVFLYGKTPEEGAQTLIHLAQSNSVKNITGQSFIEGMRVPRPFQLNNDNFCQQIWNESLKMTKLESHEIAI